MKKNKLRLSTIFVLVFFLVLLIIKISQFFISAQIQYQARKETRQYQSLVRAVICQQILHTKPKPKPLQAGKSIPANAGEVFCYSELTSLPDSVQKYLVHSWYHSGLKRSERIIPLDPEYLSVYSSCQIFDSDTGLWTVDISFLDQTLLTTLDFKVIPVSK